MDVLWREERAAFSRVVKETYAKSNQVDRDRAAADVQSRAARRDLLALGGDVPLIRVITTHSA